MPIWSSRRPAKGLRQSQALLHTWSGLLTGWVLYAIFLNGAVSYWREEITRWARPEIGATENVERVLNGALAYLAENAAGADSWTITLPGPRQTGAVVDWSLPKDKASPRHDGASDTDVLIGPEGRPVAVRATEGGDVFYRLHFDLRYVPVLWGRWIVGACTMFMAVAIVSGVITHKKIFADIFTFRPGKGQRSWLDGHNALAVLALPFHAMITYTGLVTLMTLYVPWGVMANYESRSAFFSELAARPKPAAASGEPAPLYPVALAVKAAETSWSGARAGSVRITHPGDAASQIFVVRHVGEALVDGGGVVAFDGASGRRLSASPAMTPAVATRGALIGLHAGRFAPLTLRWLFFLSGVAGTAMVATGLVLWTAKRREKLADPARPHFGFFVVERLNIGFVAGLPLAMAGFLWANRLLPLETVGRAGWEVHLMFLLWGAALLHAFWRPAQRGWSELFGLTGLLLLALPVYNMAATKRGLIDSAAVGDLPLIGMDLGLMAAGIVFVGLAFSVHRRRSSSRPGRTVRSRSSAAAAGAAVE